MMVASKKSEGYLRTKSRLLRLGWVTVLSVGLYAQAAWANDGTLLAVFADAVGREEKPTDWRFEWNARGELGEASGYEPLVQIATPPSQRKRVQYGIPDEQGVQRRDRPYQWAYGHIGGARDTEGNRELWAIATFTLTNDPPSVVWLRNGNLLSKNNTSALVVFVNDTRVRDFIAPAGRQPLLFQECLGPLRKGDVVRVAVGPGPESRGGGGTLRFVLEAFPEGVTPEDPVNILYPPITNAEAQWGFDGRGTSYLQQHGTQCEAVLRNRPELVLIGDSITARWPQELLQKHFGAVRPENLGIGGDWIQNVLWRIRNGVLDQVPVKVAVLLIGTNNLTHGFTPEEMYDGIGLLISELRLKAPGIRILLLGILPRGESLNDPINEKVRTVNKELARHADGTSIFFLDVGDALAEPDGTLLKEVFPDRLHVAMPGFIRWIDVMAPEVNKLLAMP